MSLQATHYFVYKGKRYPFNLYFFVGFSNFFYKNLSKYQQISEIKLVEEDDIVPDLSEDVIQSFINFCQKDNFSLNKENTIPLSYLAKKYEVSSLIKITDKYIAEHNSEIILQILTFNEEWRNLNTEKYEEIISAHLLEYIEDKRLLLLPIPIIHRILQKYHSSQHTQIPNTQNESKIMDFLFKYLDKNGRQASVLFADIDFGKERIFNLHKLLTEYSQKFDFNFINSTLLKTIYEFQSELVQKTEELKNDKEILQQKLQAQQETILFMKDEMKKMQDNFVEEQQKQKQREEERINQIKNEILNLVNEEIRIVKQEFKDQINNFKFQQTQHKENEKQKVEFDGKNNFCGIIFKLTKESGGNVHDKGVVNITSSGINPFHKDRVPKHAADLDNNKNYFQSENKLYSWLKYDFRNLRIRPTYYSIRARHDGPESNPKNWVIEGSNTDRDDDWKTLDTQNDAPYLTSSSSIHTFKIQPELNPNEYYQYIRIRTTGKTSTNTDYLTISALEYFGSIL